MGGHVEESAVVVFKAWFGDCVGRCLESRLWWYGARGFLVRERRELSRDFLCEWQEISFARSCLVALGGVEVGESE